MFWSKIVKKIAEKQNNKGMSIAELLIVVLILLLVSGGLVTTTVIASAQYKEAMRYSEAKVLNSTISNIIVSELTNATKFEVLDDGNVYYEGGRFVGFNTIKNDDNGYIVAENKQDATLSYKMLSDAAYTNDLKATVEVKGTKGQRTFNVTVKIEADTDGHPTTYSDSSFTVINIASL